MRGESPSALREEVQCSLNAREKTQRELGFGDDKAVFFNRMWILLRVRAWLLVATVVAPSFNDWIFFFSLLAQTVPQDGGMDGR